MLKLYREYKSPPSHVYFKDFDQRFICLLLRRPVFKEYLQLLLVFLRLFYFAGRNYMKM